VHAVVHRIAICWCYFLFSLQATSTQSVQLIYQKQGAAALTALALAPPATLRFTPHLPMGPMLLARPTNTAHPHASYHCYHNAREHGQRWQLPNPIDASSQAHACFSSALPQRKRRQSPNPTDASSGSVSTPRHVRVRAEGCRSVQEGGYFHAPKRRIFLFAQRCFTWGRLFSSCRRGG
jgi:hypothetical protein